MPVRALRRNPRRNPRRIWPLAALVAALVTALIAMAGCGTGAVAPTTTDSGPVVAGSDSAQPDPSSALDTTGSVQTTPSATPSTPSSAPTTPVPGTTATTTSAAPRPPAPAPAPARPAGTGPIIVVDPGHSVTVHGTDPATGLDVSDYANQPEMNDVFAVAELVRAQLVAAGYRVLLTKPAVDSPATLGARAQLANQAGAALALSIHDQAGSSGGIGFDQGNNIVYYQSVGSYRVTPAGTKVVFTDAAVAARSQECAGKFQAARQQAQQVPVRVQGDAGYDLGGRGLQSGRMWIVQLLATVPWIYNEAGGNSAGMVGLSAADMKRYADGLVAGVRACVPLG